MKTSLKLISLICLLCLPIAAQEKTPAAYTIDRYLNIRSAAAPSLSPDGERVAFLTNITGTPQVWMTGPQGGWPEQLTFYADRVDTVEWSPDGTGLLFTKAVGGNENAQLYWLSADGSQTKALTDAPKVRHNFGAWSHDGKRISYSSNKRDPNFFDVYVMDVASGREELVYRQDGANNALAWSYDDRQIVVSHDNEQLSLDNDLYLVDLTSRQATHLTPHEGAAQFEEAHFTRDGSALLLATNRGREWNSLARLNLQTKAIEILDQTPWDLDAVALSDDALTLGYTHNHDGYSELYLQQLDANGKFKGKNSALKLPAQGVVSGLNFSHDGRRLSFTFNSPRHNSDVWLSETKSGALTQVTRSSRAGIAQSSFIAPQLIHYKSFDGREVPAWYYRPQTAGSPSLPVIVSVHGGPEGQERPSFSGPYQYYLSRGYAVLAPNVRGSTGYGQTYTHLDDVRRREDSVKDLAAGVEWLKTEGGADAKKIAVMGGSYGGYMTLAAITLYPELWAAAVDTVGIANFESFLRNTSGYRRKLREVEYGSLEHDLDFLKAISPLGKVDRIRTPLMVIHGKNDPRVPYTEAEQIVKALRARNAPVEYALFDDEGHGIAKLSNRLIVYPKIGDFLDRYLK